MKYRYYKSPLLLVGLILVFSVIIPTSRLLMASNETEQPIPVERVELKKYTGLWYEIAKIPNRFQKKCAGNTSAFYSLRKDGRIDVVNRCIGRDNEQSEAKGVAKVVDKKSNAKLKVSFVKLFGISLFWGDYWIIGLDKDYTYAVVGTPDRKYGWILSRTRTLSEEQLDRIFSLLRKQGYNPDDFEMTKHSPLSNKALAP